MESHTGPQTNTSREYATISLDDAEDLTLYADEEFDTEEVDLFEFTTDDDYPLTQLKSIILSLDWEITDTLLADLTEEIAHLRELWGGDRIIQLYLQGLDKIGRYIRAKQAFAHPNSIKLLQTYFYDLEQILSSPDLTEEQISNILKTDVRKFQILQYQISQTQKTAGAAAEGAEFPSGTQHDGGQKTLRDLKAAVLGLDWEITEEGLKDYTEQLQLLKNQYRDDRYLQILINGLIVLGGYISEQQANAHPEAFSLLYTFYETVELFINNEELDEKERKELTVDRASKLSSLKSLIAATPRTEIPTPEQPTEGEEEEYIIDEVPDFETGETVTDEQEFAAGPAGIAADDEFLVEETVTGTEQIAPQAAPTRRKGVVDEEITLDISEEIDSHLSSFFNEKATSAPLANDEELAYASEEIDFSDTSMGEEVEDYDDTPITSSLAFDPLSDDIEQLDDDAIQPLDERFAGDLTSSGIEEEDLPPALSDIGEGTYDTTNATDELDFDSGTDFLTLSDTAETEVSPGDSKSATDEKAAPTDSGDTIAPALSDFDNEAGFDEEEFLGDEAAIPSEAIEDKLVSFFGPDDDTAVAQPSRKTATPAPAVGKNESKAAAPPVDEEEDLVAPALAGFDDEAGFSEEELDGKEVEISAEDVEDKLSSFFGPDDESTTTDTVLTEDTGEAPEIPALDEDEFKAAPALDEEGDLVAPALADFDDEAGFSEEELDGKEVEISAEDVEDKLSSFFGPDEDSTTADTVLMEETEEAPEIPALAEDEFKASPALEEDGDLVAPALADFDDEAGFSEEELDGKEVEISAEDVEDKLSSFFGPDEDSTTADTVLMEETEEAPEIPALAEDESKAAPMPDEDEPLTTPALADSDEEAGFSEDEFAEKDLEIPTDKIEDKLSSFFGADEEAGTDEPLLKETGETPEIPALDEDEPVTTPALADSDEETGFSEDEFAEKDLEIPTDKIEDKLSSFFGSDEEADTDETVPGTTEETLEIQALEEEEIAAQDLEVQTEDVEEDLSSFFGYEDDTSTEETFLAETEETLEIPTIDEEELSAVQQAEPGEEQQLEFSSTGTEDNYDLVGADESDLVAEEESWFGDTEELTEDLEKTTLTEAPELESESDFHYEELQTLDVTDEEHADSLTATGQPDTDEFEESEDTSFLSLDEEDKEQAPVHEEDLTATETLEVEETETDFAEPEIAEEEEPEIIIEEEEPEQTSFLILDDEDEEQASAHEEPLAATENSEQEIAEEEPEIIIEEYTEEEKAEAEPADLDDSELMAPVLAGANEEVIFDESTLAEEEPDEEPLEEEISFDEEVETEGQEVTAATSEEKTSGEITPALSHTRDEDLTEREALKKIEQKPDTDIQERLISFFGQVDTATKEALQKERATLRDQDEDARDGGAPQGWRLAEPTGGDTELMSPILKDLQQCFQKISSTAGNLTPHINTGTELIRRLRQHAPLTSLPLLQLLDSALTLLPTQAEHLPKSTETLFVYLYNNINMDNSITSAQRRAIVTAAFDRYSQWQKELFDILATLTEPTAAAEQDMNAEYKKLSEEIRTGLDDLRTTLKQEIDNLREELASR